MRDKTDKAAIEKNEFNPVTSRKIIRSFKAKEDSKRTVFEKLADFFTSSFVNIPFLIANTIFFMDND